MIERSRSAALENERIHYRPANSLAASARRRPERFLHDPPEWTRCCPVRLERLTDFDAGVIMWRTDLD
jgi:hypothetical protein